MKQSIIWVTFFVLFSSCTDKYAPLDRLSWISGKWRTDVKGNELTENWSRTNDSTWMGQSAFMENGKIRYTETMSIRLRENKLQFITAVSNQNDGKEVAFNLISQSESQFVFENPTHDFPQRITYVYKGENKLYAYISSDINGKEKRVEFHFQRVP